MKKITDLLKKNFISMLLFCIFTTFSIFILQKNNILIADIKSQQVQINNLKNDIQILEGDLSSLNDDIFVFKHLNISDKFNTINKKISELEEKIEKNEKLGGRIKENILKSEKKIISIYNNQKNNGDKDEILKNFLELKKTFKVFEKKIEIKNDKIIKNQKIEKGQKESIALKVDINEYNTIKKISKIEKKIIGKQKIDNNFYKNNFSYLFNYDRNNSVKLIDFIKKPQSIKRVNVKKGSFSEWIRNLPLKKEFTGVYSRNGKKLWDKHRVSGILNWDIWKNQQCADSVMRLRGEYNFAKNSINKIDFKLENNLQNPYLIKNLDRKSFKKYMLYQFAYSSTYVLKRDLKTINKNNVLPGDLIVLRKGGSKTGHAYMIMDVAEDLNGKKNVVLGQGDIPTQDFTILKNKPYNNGYAYYNDKFTEKKFFVKILSNLKASLFGIFNKGNNFMANLTGIDKNNVKKIVKKDDFSKYNSWFELDKFLEYAEKYDPNGKPVIKRFE
ncbi:hypothetical protein LR002_00200 [Candidatus Gracilibacteria bacterium]|nr:hypothetical protein [Candidatus Gracilibacteria bacterium]